ncbi:MAG: cytochrome c oxidase accessory protein CcoG [Chitinophagales bacterium]
MSKADDTFRDSIGTVTKEGKRNWIFAKRPAGKLYNYRSYLSVVYLLLFFTLPWIKIHGEPFLMLNIVDRKFNIFGMVFWPQDFFLFVIAMLTFMVFIVLFTVVYGRVFCGWVCPQTIFMEMVFRKVEYWIDGDAVQQKVLAQARWNARKIYKRSLKFVLFWLISFVIANYFLAYLIGMDQVLLYVKEGVGAHLGIFIPLLVFTSVFFFVYWWFREQVCLIVCPYGRLQGVMLDRNSIVVAYDYVRGEPRGRISRHGDQQLGDCIDCLDCVKVCPTGIDIRNGTQLECVNCTACIDACNAAMERVNRHPDLIKFASEATIANNEKLRFTPRMVGYTAVLSVLVIVLCGFLATRKDVSVNIMRAQGALYQEQPGGKWSNLYTIKVLNKSHRDLPVALKVEDMPEGKASVNIVGQLIAKKEGDGDGVFFVIVDKGVFHTRKNKVTIGVYAEGKKLDAVTTSFIIPNE